MLFRRYGGRMTLVWPMQECLVTLWCCKPWSRDKLHSESIITLFCFHLCSQTNKRNFRTKIQAMWRSFRCPKSHFAFLTNLVTVQGFCKNFLPCANWNYSYAAVQNIVSNCYSEHLTVLWHQHGILWYSKWSNDGRFRSYTCRDSFFQTLADVMILQRFVQWRLR